MESAPEFAIYFKWKVRLGEMPWVDKKSSKTKAQLPHIHVLQGVQCSAKTGCNIFLCNQIKNGVPVSCHLTISRTITQRFHRMNDDQD